MIYDADRFATYRQRQLGAELAKAENDVQKEAIRKRYKTYLESERHAIYGNANAAERWAGFTENADLYPNLEWRTAGDSDVRPEHAKLDGLILPVNDPFWNSHTPPLGFGCRCELTQTDKKTVEKDGYKDTGAPKGFDFNPGIEQKLFSNSAGYYTSAPKADVELLEKWAGTVSGKISKEFVRDKLNNTNKVVKIANGDLKGAKYTISNGCIKRITGKPHENQYLRDFLLTDIENVVKNAIQVNTAKDIKTNLLKHKNIAAWHYYQVKGFDNMFLNFKVNVDKKGKETVILHSISDSIKK